MFVRHWVRLAILIAGGVAGLAVGIFVFRAPLQERANTQLAAQSAQSAFGAKKLNVLILGYQDDEATTDTIVLAHLDVDRRIATLMSIPRDTWVAVPGHGKQKINAAYAYGGTASTAKAVSALMGGIPIDATVALQPEGAAQIVDAMGGLNVNVDETMDYDDYNGQFHVHLKKGERYLTGSQVVGYIRFRHDAASDYGRMRRQQQVLKLLMDQLSQPQNWAKLPRLFKFARKDLQTSLSDGQLLALLEVYRSVRDDDVRAFTLPSKAGWVGDASVVFADPRWAKFIGDLLFKKMEPPQDVVVVANATGNPDVDKTVIAALRGSGWNVPTYVDQPARTASYVMGDTIAAQLLAKTFAAGLRSGRNTTLVIGSDNAPDTE